LVNRSKGKQLTSSYLSKCPQDGEPGWRALLLASSLGDTCDAPVLFCCPSAPEAEDPSQHLVSHAYTTKAQRWELWFPNGLETGGVGQGGASQQKMGVQVWLGGLGLEEHDGFPWAQGSGGACRAGCTQRPSALPVATQ